MHRGYIKIWRRISDAGWLKNHKLWAFWSWCLLKASHKEFDMIVGCQNVHLMPGDFIVGLKAAAKELNMSIQSIRTLLNFLKTSQNLTIKSTNKFSIISIINWNTYQGEEIEINNQTNKPLTNNQQTTNNKQELKELKELKEYIQLPYENIKLTQKEYDNLKNKLGQTLLDKVLDYFSKYKIEKSYKTKSDNLTIQRWVIDAVKEKENKTNGNAKIRTYPGRGNNNNQGGLDAKTEAELDRITAEYYENKSTADDKKSVKTGNDR